VDWQGNSAYIFCCSGGERAKPRAYNPIYFRTHQPAPHAQRRWRSKRSPRWRWLHLQPSRWSTTTLTWPWAGWDHGRRWPWWLWWRTTIVWCWFRTRTTSTITTDASTCAPPRHMEDPFLVFTSFDSLISSLEVFSFLFYTLFLFSVLILFVNVFSAYSSLCH